MFKRSLVRFLVGITALVATAESSKACQCVVGVTPRFSVGHSPIIFSGKVVDVQHGAPDSNPKGLVATIDVVERWKGAVPDRVTVYGSTSGATCGYSNYPVGKTVTLFAHPLPLNNPRLPDLITNYCSGSGILSESSPLAEALYEFREGNNSVKAAMVASGSSIASRLKRPSSSKAGVTPQRLSCIAYSSTMIRLSCPHTRAS